MISATFIDKRSGTGTREWADYSYNICRGCAHGCLYCYAKARACRTEPRMRKPGEWARQRLNPNPRCYGQEVGAKGVVMFPTSHDLTPRYLRQSLQTIQNLVIHNRVLVVSKPHWPVVRIHCRELAGCRDRVMFRFTIGSLNPEQCQFWEPGAPPPGERLRALKHAFQEQFQTSVSIEPMLDDGAGTCRLVSRVEEFVTDTIWVGKMQRVPRKDNRHVAGFEDRLETIRACQTDEKILELVAALKAHPKVRWKDSIKKVLAKTAAT